MSSLNSISLKRREALKKLGLAATALYATPTITRLDTAVAAFPSQCKAQGVAHGCHNNRPKEHPGKSNGRGNW